MLTIQNIEAELSYAYLHAVAAKAGFACQSAERVADAFCVDATIREDGRSLAPDSLLSFSVDVQLKATFQELAESGGRFSFPLPVHQYDRLRSVNRAAGLLLVILRLPPNPEEWLTISEDALVAKRCAYWVSLHGAPATTNASTETVYVPRANVLSPAGLLDLMTRFSRREVITYAG